MPAAPPAPPLPPRGTLVVLGGGADDPLLALLAGLLPHPDAPIEVLTTATREQPERTAAAYARAWASLGCGGVGHLPIDEHHPADLPATLARLEAATLILLSGGDQERLTNFLLGTEFLASLKRRFRQDEGFIIAGTSAGASALGGPMLVQGQGWRSLLGEGIEVVPGLGLLPDVILDQHFAERSRYPRLLHAVLQHPACLGLGLSEETGLIIRPGRPAEVFGEGVVAAVDARGLSFTDADSLPPSRPVSGHGLRLHLLTAGQTLDLTSRAAGQGAALPPAAARRLRQA
ncbi:cyanophycinase [uncultured Hymenobacter sp.]|uniref:cyanophycinase n=1 Tax=uncultured Hymenobacter sp. TaxID=170016 RepID=UPI0035C98173